MTLALGLLLVAGTARAGTIYLARDESGNLLFTDSPTTPDAVVVFAREPPAADPTVDHALLERKFDPLILQFAEQYRVDPFLVKAMIRTESKFDPGAVSAAGARGLMQLMPGTAERFGVKNVHDPAQNIRGGVAYLRWLLDEFRGDRKLAVAAYNCGEGVVRRVRRVPEIRETLGYVAKVEEADRDYRERGFSARTLP